MSSQAADSSKETKNRSKTNTQIDIVDREDSNVRVRIKEHHQFGAIPLSIDISIVGTCVVESGATDEDVKLAVRDGGYSLYAKRTQLIGLISEAAIGVPIILPPAAEYPPEVNRKKDGSR